MRKALLTIAIITAAFFTSCGGKLDKDAMCDRYNYGCEQIHQRKYPLDWRYMLDVSCGHKYVDVHRDGYTEKVEVYYNAMGVYVLKDDTSYDGMAYFSAVCDDDLYNDEGLPYFVQCNELDEYGRDNYIKLEQPYHK